MNQTRKELDRIYLVQCIWCGSKILDDKEEESKGV